MTAIINRHATVQGQLFSADGTIRKLVSGLKFTMGVERIFDPCVVLRFGAGALKLSTSLERLFLLAIMSAHRASELYALCYKEPYLAMSSTGVVLYLNIDFLPKFSSWFHVTQLIEVLAMHGELQPVLHLLCVRQALKFYLL